MQRPWLKLTSRRIGMLLVLLGFVWGCTLIHLTLTRTDQSDGGEALRKKILTMSREYVKEVAKRAESSPDGLLEAPDEPAAGYGFDMKKGFAVLLDDMLKRLDKLEGRFNKLDSHNVDKDKEDAPVSIKSNLEGVVHPESCEIPNAPEFPHCGGKMEWMKGFWTSDPCYADYGVDGSTCSFLVYLSEIESWCPPLPWRKNFTSTASEEPGEMASLQEDSDPLLRMLSSDKSLLWIKMRVERMWPQWVEAANSLASSLANRKKKRILIHLGLLSKEAEWHFGEKAFDGGPLGELVQWSDIIASVYILGHDLDLSFTKESLKRWLNPRGSRTHAGEIHHKPGKLEFDSQKNKGGCPIKGKPPADIIYIDILGLAQIKKTLGMAGIQHYACYFRVVDSFGTEPEFNFRPYAKQRSRKSPWGGWNFNPLQFFTMFPHSPDNSFMGFVVEQHLNKTEIQDIQKIKRQHQVLVYGKNDYMWAGSGNLMNNIRKHFQIHATVAKNNDDQQQLENVPSFINNHGVLPSEQLYDLLKRTKLFVGLGFPYEGPAPLEAIASGCVFLNPKFVQPKSRLNTKFFEGKPTFRQLTSQHPYVEVFVGKPHVYTVDIDDAESVEAALTEIKNSKVDPYLPYEFTAEGMLQRVSTYIQKHDFCSPHTWPPESALQVRLSGNGQSCKQACQDQGLICEPSFFPLLNNKDAMEKNGIKCNSMDDMMEIYAPSKNDGTGACSVQSERLLYSCVGQDPDYQRICPCRDFIHGQVALCHDCL
ncbi:alpha-1,6-mannosylglycoprotein 6-beta-N-acetylglucosaminyltransferase A-like isoform X1 [Branchiostoma lanceolatum]|uniref:alpha-1,6-mannosylglycoprotein 6-beta-N-acetylglucosaminyltransferase A-like isoform X1 n=1 Tax=Branchiostoma lanceolatum TaxID=7740 RepID=UPI003455FC98